jgi:glycerophosphoryl diester phosphodiesterase
MVRLLLVGLLFCACSGQLFAATEPQYPEPPNRGSVYVIAHRGAHQGIPENTLAAYRKAIELGADFVEIDVRTTKDGKCISIHNRTVDAYTVDGTRGKVSDFTLPEIKSLDIGSRVDPKWSSERVPTLDEILKLCKGKIGIFLDLKDASIDEVAHQIKAHGMHRQVVWCISPDQVTAVKRSCAECLPMPDPESEETLPRMLEQTAAKIVAPVWSDFSPTFAAKCHSTGVIVFVDEQKSDPSHWQLLLDWGADGIQTDAPEQLINFLRRRD